LNDRLINRAFTSLQKHLNDNVVKDKVLAKETTMRVGGPASIFAVAGTLEQLEIVVSTVNEWELDLFVIGKGSNLLVSDSGYPGLVLKLGSDFTRKRIEGSKIRVGAAASLPLLVQEAGKFSLEGLSFAVGIPGSVGGAVKMNAGAHKGSIGDIVKQVLVFTRGCQLHKLDSGDIVFGYRKSDFNKKDIIVETTLELIPGNCDTIRNRMEEYFDKRKQSQPLQFPNAGSVFRNSTGFTAGYLIEKASCKGLIVGDAQVSEKHANFIINKGQASATDVFTLVRMVQQRVYETSGIILEPEIEFLGEFDNILLTAKN
jgi:UDP-N-acetylmuramate dehydrogenase